MNEPMTNEQLAENAKIILSALIKSPTAAIAAYRVDKLVGEIRRLREENDQLKAEQKLLRQIAGEAKAMLKLRESKMPFNPKEITRIICLGMSLNALEKFYNGQANKGGD